MFIRSLIKAPHSRSFVNALAVALSAVLGLVVGLVIALHYCDRNYSWMPRLSVMPLSIVGAVFVWLLPLMMSLVAAFINIHLLPAVVFLKSFCFAFCLCLTTHVFGECGWIVRMCLLFTDSCSFLFLCRFWYCCAVAASMRRTLLPTILTLSLVSAIDYMYIAPFTAVLINSF